MSVIEGAVVNVMVSRHVGKLSVKPTDSSEEIVILWSDTPKELVDQMLYSSWVSLASQALAHGKRISVTTMADDSSVVTHVALKP